MGKYILQFLIAIDQLFNTLLNGYADETLSARAYRAERDGKIFGKIFRPMIDLLFFFQHMHCHQAYMAEKKRQQLPPEFRNG